MPKVSIILLNWNGWGDTIACLKSLKDLNYESYEILVIDNGSVDESLEEFSKFKKTSDAPEFSVIENKENLGFSAGNNVGIKNALENKTDYVLILNNDTVVEKDFLKEMVWMAQKGKKVGMVGAKICFEDKRNIIWHAGGGKFNWVSGSTPNGYEKSISYSGKETLDFITGACVLVSKEAIERAGLLDERFFLYYEDVEWSLRMRKKGFKLEYAENAIVYHKVHASTKKIINPIIWYYHVRNVLLTVRLQAPVYMKPLVYVWAIWRWYIKQYIKEIIWRSKKKEAQLIRRGLSDFWASRFGKLDS